MARGVNAIFLAAGLLLSSVVLAPQVLAFPFQARFGTTTVYAETPIDRAAMVNVLERADRRLATSPLYTSPVGTRVFLTDGGWRWRVLALTSADTLALTRPGSDLVSDAVLINRSDAARDRMLDKNGTLMRRSLSSIIAHERTHIMVRRHLGMINAIMLPRWISEGYADHVAGESTLTAAEVATKRARGEKGRAVFYFEARRRVSAVLAANGNNVEALLMQDTE